MTWLEIVAVIFSLLCVWFSVRKNVLTWPLGMIGVTAYFFLFYKNRLYADMMLQVFFVAQGVYGWINWGRKKNEEASFVPQTISLLWRFIYIFILIAGTVLWALLLKKYSNATIPYPDAFASTCSIVANLLLARKKIENWILWMVADVIYIILFFYKELYLSAGIYFIFLILCFVGFIEWRKKIIKKDLY